MKIDQSKMVYRILGRCHQSLLGKIVVQKLKFSTVYKIHTVIHYIYSIMVQFSVSHKYGCANYGCPTVTVVQKTPRGVI